MSTTGRAEAFWRRLYAERGITRAQCQPCTFGDTPQLVDALAALVVGGDKRATAGLAHGSAEPPPRPGDLAVVLDAGGEPACVIRWTEVVVRPLTSVDAAFAWDQGEGDRSLEFWMRVHRDRFARQARDAGFDLPEDSQLVCQRFELVWPGCPALVRPETAADVDAVRTLTAAAFAASELGHNGEAALVDSVRAAHRDDILSLVAELGGEVVGHILFSPATLGDLRGLGLAPMSVAPAHQGKRIGAALVRAALARARRRACPFVVVLGHPDYYPRFGFRPAVERGITCAFSGVPDEAWMVLQTDPGVELPTGVAHYVEELEAGVAGD